MSGFGSKIVSFAKAISSRGLSDKKTDPFTKKLRVISCFGGDEKGVLPPCEFLAESKTEGKFFCNGCGCGDRKMTWLVADGDDYSKLDFPTLNCPLKMPGFSNYEISSAEESVSPITRRWYIEQLSEEEISKIPVTENDIPPETKEKLREKIKEANDKAENE
tara:strand:- start:449 stop:934 length:486 start_codon:yes stop_codon:yes gene_type:complete